MSPGLLDSPFAALEAAVSDERPIPIGIAAPPETIADRVVAQRAAETRGRPGAE